MLLKFIGSNSKISKSELINSCNFFIKKLLTTAQKQNILVEVKFDSDVRTYFGYALKLSDRYQISINPRLSKQDILITLAHEFVHIKQYIKGDLDYGKNCMVWRGKEWPQQMLYPPYEEEAEFLENILYNEYIDWTISK